MEITSRSFWTLLHGVGFGGLYLLACTGALVELYRYAFAQVAVDQRGESRFLRLYLTGMTVLAWLTVISGTYFIYPWYRAPAPAGQTDLQNYPQLLLKSHPETLQWHAIGMEWKEHVAWLVPIAITMATVVVWQYGRHLRRHAGVRTAVLGFVIVSFGAAAVAGFFGAMLDKYAPVQGGRVLQILPRKT